MPARKCYTQTSPVASSISSECDTLSRTSLFKCKCSCQRHGAGNSQDVSIYHSNIALMVSLKMYLRSPPPFYICVCVWLKEMKCANQFAGQTRFFGCDASGPFGATMATVCWHGQVPGSAPKTRPEDYADIGSLRYCSTVNTHLNITLPCLSCLPACHDQHFRSASLLLFDPPYHRIISSTYLCV